MKSLKRKVVCIFTSALLIFITICANNPFLYASSVSATANTSSVSPGGTFTVTVNINGGGSGGFYFSGSNATVSTGYRYCDDVCQITATAGSSGTATVSVSGGAVGTEQEVTDKDGNNIYVSTSASVSIISNTGGNNGGSTGGGQNTPETENEEDKPDKDSASTLSSLTIDKGKLTPAFSETETAYTLNLAAGTTSIHVSATPKQESASVEGTGDIALKSGENTIEIKCIAEDGSSTTYVIKAVVNAKPIANIPYGKSKLGLLNETTGVPKLFNETKITIDGHEVIAWTNEKLHMTLLYMLDEKTNEKNLYLYDTKKKEVISIYKPFAYNGKNLVMIDVPKELQKKEGMNFTTIKLGDYTLPGWEFKDKKFKNYALLYVMDDKGNTLYYQYERSEDSLQLYSQAAAIQQDDYDSYVKKMNQQSMIYLIGISVLSVLLIASVIVLFIKRKNQAKFKKVAIENSSLSAEAKSLLHEEE